MSQNSAASLGLVAFMRQRLRDVDDDNRLFTDEEYEGYLWATVKYRSRQTVYAYLHDDRLWMYNRCGCGGDLWRVRVTTPVVGQSYQINEPAGIVFNPEGGETADPLTLTATVCSLDRALWMAITDASSNPAKAAVYFASNGLVVDSRDAASVMREHASHVIGVH